MPTRKPPKDDADQSARFITAAKEVEAEKDGRAFMRAFGVVVPPLEAVVTSPVSLTNKAEKPKITAPKAGKKKAAGASGKTS